MRKSHFSARILAFLLAMLFTVCFPFAALAENETPAPAAETPAPAAETPAPTADAPVLPALSLVFPCDGAWSRNANTVLLYASCPVTAAADGSVEISVSEEAYAAHAKSAVILPVGDGVLLMFDASRFVSVKDGTTRLTLPADKKATLSVAEGAYLSDGKAASKAFKASFTPASDGAEGRQVCFVLPSDGWTVTYNDAALKPTQAVPDGAAILLNAPKDFQGQAEYLAFVNGKPIGDFRPAGYTVKGDILLFAALKTPASQDGKDAAKVEPSEAKKASVPILAPAALQPPAKPEPPTIETKSATGFTVRMTDGFGYSIDGINWQIDPAFVELTAGQTYQVVQRVEPNGAIPASAASDPTPVTLEKASQAAPLAPVLASKTAASVTLVGIENGEYSVDGSNWQSEPTFVNLSAGTTYQFVQRYRETAGASASAASAPLSVTLEKPAAETPAAPTAASISANSVTLTAISGMEYSVDGVTFRDSPAFSGLVEGAAYNFYQRVKETAALAASPVSPALTVVATNGTLSGQIAVSCAPQYGKTMTASIRNANVSAASVSITWYKNGAIIATGTSYEVRPEDIGQTMAIEATSSEKSGSIAGSLGTVAKAEYLGDTPLTPQRESRTSSSVTLVSRTGYEYSMDGKHFQDSAKFSGLDAGETYTFFQRVRETATTKASPVSAKYTTATSAASGSGSTSSGSSAASTPVPEASSQPATSSSLSSYTLTNDNTRVLFSTMQSLVNGNKSSDVTLTLSNATFTFTKGTMQLTEGTLWYDFGVTVDGGANLAAIRSLAGKDYVAAVHFNHSGELPGKASIRLYLGAGAANKAMQYKKYDPAANALVYMQDVTADSMGYATVTQTSCSDYVFVTAAQSAAAPASPVPSDVPTQSAEPTMLVTEPAKESGGSLVSLWIIALIILASLALIVVGVRAYLISKQVDDEEDETDSPDPDDPDDSDDGGDIRLFDEK